MNAEDKINKFVPYGNTNFYMRHPALIVSLTRPELLDMIKVLSSVILSLPDEDAKLTDLRREYERLRNELENIANAAQVINNVRKQYRTI